MTAVGGDDEKQEQRGEARSSAAIASAGAAGPQPPPHPEELLVAAKLELEPSLDFGGVARVLNELESAIRARLPSVGIMYLEPDLHDPGRAPPSGLGPIPTGGDPPSDGSVDSSQAGGDP